MATMPTSTTAVVMLLVLIVMSVRGRRSMVWSHRIEIQWSAGLITRFVLVTAGVFSRSTTAEDSCWDWEGEEEA
jgi:hypothetical protein